MKKIKVRVMTGAEFDALSDNDNFTWDDDVVLIVIHDNGKICIDLQTECTRATTIINRLRKAVEGCTDRRITEEIKKDIFDWIDCITESTKSGIYSDASRFWNSETGKEEFTGDYSYGVEFVGDDDIPECYMFLNFLTSETIDRALETAQSVETTQTTENTPDNINTPTAGAETTTDTITASAEREVLFMLKTNSRKAKENTRQYIMDHICVDDYGINEPETITEAAQIIYNNFRSTHQWEIDRYGEFTAFADWCAGLPSILDTCYFYNRSAVDDLGAILEESEAEKSKYSESDAERVLTLLIYREIKAAIERGK